MSADDPTLPGRIGARRPRPTSARSIRAIAEITPLIVDAFGKPSGTEREELLAEVIGKAIDIGRESGEQMAATIKRLEGELNDERQAKLLLGEKVARLQKALDDANARLARGDR